MRRLPRRRPLALAVTLVLAAIGVVGAYSYWESYYQHRGFATLAFLPHARRGRRVVVNFYSPALHRMADYLVYLPPGYNPARQRYPVYYLLHGSPGRPQVYFAIADMDVRLDNLLSLRRIRPMIMVFPDGRIGGSLYSDSEWANTPSGKYMSYVVNVVHDVDRRFATIPHRVDRVIGGFSAGAYGATNVALHNLSLFGNLQSWSGYYVETRTGVFSRASRAVLADNSPLYYARRLRRRLAADPFRAFLFIGRDDGSSPQQGPMATELAARGVEVSYALYHGGHDWQLWHAHLNQMLELASRDFGQPLRAGRGAAHTLTPGVKPIPNGLGRRHHRRGERAQAHHRRERAHAHHRRQPAHVQRHRERGHIRHRRRASHQRVKLAAATIPLGSGPRAGNGSSPTGSAELVGGLLLALGSAALINLGFLLQHRGLPRRGVGGLAAALRGASRNRTWLAGQAIGWIGFAAQIVAVAVAPLALVQAFAAGGLALSVPLAAGIFLHRITRGQLLAVLAMAVGLAVLPIGFSTGTDRLAPNALIATSATVVVAGAVLAAGRRPGLLAVAAGAFYGVADAAIKAVSTDWHVHGAAALWSGWTVLAALATFAGFLAFQAALQSGNAISSISLMNALAALVALACGLIAFGEKLGTSPTALIAHGLAIAVILGCVPVLAAAQMRLAAAAEHGNATGAPPAPTVTA
jgi:enterochelin esterase-like enzyme